MNGERKNEQNLESSSRNPMLDTSEADIQKPVTEKAKKKANDLIIVGLGASAGGLDALQKVLPGLPSKAGIAYVIVQHLAPKHRSLLPSLLAKHTGMPVETISDGMPVHPDVIYITPPNYDVKLSRSRLRLSSVSSIGPRPSIDYFFTSLAEEKRAHAVGIILSGSGTDGAHGIRAIKSNDGITMAQIPDSAKFYSMPQSAIETGLVDLVVPPEKIGRELEAALKYPKLIANVPLDTHKDEISTILDLLQQRSGVDFSDYKQGTIHRRISRRMVVHKMQSLQDYVAYIKQQPRELFLLHKDLLISVTSFFRDSKAFEALARRLGELLKAKQEGDTFRAWVPGCSTGEEAYSIAILVAEILGKNLRKYRIQIFATDVDEDSVQLARKGIYPLATVMDTDGRRFEKHFSHIDNTVTVNKQIRDMVVLARQDLVKDTPFLHLDLISCRNLMIYLNAELQDKLLSLFHFSLNPDGLLFLGKSESINQRMDLFKTMDSRWKIYRRREIVAKRLPKLMLNHQVDQLAHHRAYLNKQQDNVKWREGIFADSLLSILGCCAVLTDEHANILYIRGDVSPYLKIPQGSLKENLNVIEMASPEIRFVLQSMLYKSNKDELNITSNDITLGEKGQTVRIKIGPAHKKNAEGNRMIVFSPVEMPKPAPRHTVASGEGDHVRIKELEQELAVTRDHLQDTIEELETTSEELQSLNEELQSANEELQASNEELETSNEELQASNEELNTVNDELRAKSEEAAELLENLKKSEAALQQSRDELEHLVRRRTAELEKTVTALSNEIAERQNTERKLRKLSKVFMDASDPIIIEDLDTRILDLNKAAEDFHDFPRNELIGRSIKDLIPPHRHALADELRQRCLDGETVHNWEGLRLNRQGDNHPVLVTAFALKGDGDQPETIATIAKDISEMKSMQREVEQRADQLARLTNELTLAEQRERRRLAKLLHDHLQQLLAGAKMRLEILIHENDIPGLQDTLHLVTESLASSRSLSAELSPPVLYQHGLAQALRWLARWAENMHGLKVQLTLDEESAPQKEELKILLFESVKELLFNVAKHADTKSVNVQMSCRGERTTIIVSDAGVGFETQGCCNGSMEDNSGYGLFNIRERLQLIGGSFEVVSKPGQGTSVTLTAPLQTEICKLKKRTEAPAAERMAIDKAKTSRPVRRPGDKITVMLVDDHAVLRNGMSAILSRQPDIEILGEAADGEEAVRLARELQPDVILMDINMPKMDGVEATRLITSELPGTCIIALSMYDAEDQAAVMKQSGASAYLNKTGSVDELLATIRRHRAQ